MARLLIAVVLALAAAAVAAWLARRTQRQPMGDAAWTVPAQLERSDFARPDAPWLVVLFSAGTCDTCRSVWERVSVLDAADVATQNLDATLERALHQRYRIDAVPLLLIADDAGVVRRHFLGPVTAADLWGALAELRG